jgi:hypothetical protein
VKKNPQAI